MLELTALAAMNRMVYAGFEPLAATRTVAADEIAWSAHAVTA